MTTKQFLDWFASATMQEVNDYMARNAQRAAHERREEQIRAEHEQKRIAAQHRQARSKYTRELQRRAIVQRAYAKTIERARLVRQRRSRVDWEELTGNHEIARRQIAWERGQTALAMRRAGLKLKEIAHRLAVSSTRASQIIDKAEVLKKWERDASPVEGWMQWKPTADEPVRKLHRMIKTLDVVAYQPKRDWLLVGSGRRAA